MTKSVKRFHPLSGTAIKTEKGHYYIKNGVRIPITSRSVLKSWRFYRIVKTTEEAVSHLPAVGKLGFRDGTLIYCIADASYYIIAGNKLVKVTDPEQIRSHGLKARNAFWVSAAERDLHRRAE